MDANGTRFHILLGRADWTTCLCAERVDTPDSAWRIHLGDPAAPAELDEATSEVTLRRRGFKFTAAVNDNPPDLALQRRGAAADLYGNWYWIDAIGKRIHVRSAGSNTASEFWPAAEPETPEKPGDFVPVEAPAIPAAIALRGLTVTADHYLVAGTLEPAGLLIFDLFAGGGPQHLLWPEEIDFEPFDIAAGPECGLWILDRHHKRYWVLDRRFNVSRDGQSSQTLQETADQTFQPASGTTTRRIFRRTFPTGVNLDAAQPLPANDPVSIEVAADGTVLILDLPKDGARPLFSSILAIHQGEWKKLSLETMRDKIAIESRDQFSLVGYDFAFVASDGSDDEIGTVFVADSFGNQAYAFRLERQASGLALTPVAEYLPMRRFGGKALASYKDMAYYDFADSWVPLADQPRPRYQEEASLRTAILDGKEPDCIWHRVLLDACIPPDTTVELWTRAANERQLLEAASWSKEPQLYLRGDGSELPFVSTPWPVRHKTGARALGEGTWELLLQRARGRYLEVRIRLTGNERSSPRLRAMRIYYPRFSYLREYLPAVYREDNQSANFLDGFLANLEGFYTGIEDRIANSQILFDWRSAPREALEWLAGWLGAALDPAWDEERKRLFIRHAMLYFQYRGTAHGLRLALSLALDEAIDESRFDVPERVSEERFGVRIVEKYLTRSLPDVLFGDPAQLEAPALDDTVAWKPQDGGAALRQRYARFRGMGDSTPPPEFPLVAPADPEKPKEAGLWVQFAERVLGFTPWAAALEREAWQLYLSATYRDFDALNVAWQSGYGDFTQIELPADQPVKSPRREDWAGYMRHPQPACTPTERRRWQSFLHSRYGSVSALNAKYGKSWESIDLVPLPDRLPADGPALEDWFQFESAVLAIAGAAYRFSVLLPMPTGIGVSPAEPRRRIDLATRIVNLEKPAHAVFDVRFYWAMFRIGEARLGRDTLIDVGVRERLIPALVLGQGYVGEGYVAPTEIEDRADRQILGCDRLLH